MNAIKRLERRLSEMYKSVWEQSEGCCISMDDAELWTELAQAAETMVKKWDKAGILDPDQHDHPFLVALRRLQKEA